MHIWLKNLNAIGLLALITASCASIPVAQKSPEAQVKVETVPGTDIYIWRHFLPQAKEHYRTRVAALENLPVQEGGVLFLGDSITEGMDTNALFPDIATVNYGIGWDVTHGVGHRIDQITRNTPERVFVMIGTNNLMYGHSASGIHISTMAIIDVLHAELPDTEIYVQSVLPREVQAIEIFQDVNARLAASASEEPYVFLNLAPHFAAEDGSLKSDYTEDNLHLNEQGYTLWQSLIQTCVLHGCDGI